MAATFQIFLILLAVLAGTALLARRLDVAPAILLLLAGIALAFVPSMPSLELPPELVLLLVLPPLIYSASVAMSWREFKFNLRPIVLLAVGCVIFTAIAFASATNYVMGITWSIVLLLCAIVAFPAPWRHKLLGVALGFLAIQGLNLVRIIALFYLHDWNQVWFEWFHLYLWPALIILDALVVWLIWRRGLPRSTTAHA